MSKPKAARQPLHCDFDRAPGKDGRPGRILPSQGNIRSALAGLQVRLTYDELKEVALCDGARLSDEAVTRLWLKCEAEYKFRPPKDLFFDVVQTVAWESRFHPVKDYLDKLKWDGEPRLDCWLVDYMGAEDSTYVRAVGAIVLIAAVRRVREPGCKFDELLILESPQGDGKSTAIKALAGGEGWYTDNLALSASPKEWIEQTAGFWIVEVPELSGLRRADWDRLKAALSRQKDVARLSYGRLPTERLRQFIAIGTTNNPVYLSDPTGNRRFWPVRLGCGIAQPALEAARNQLWAEAAHREAAGESIRLATELWPLASAEQAERMRQDPWYSRLEDVLGEHSEGRIKAEALWHIVGVGEVSKRTPAMSARIEGAMAQLGWRKGRSKGRLKFAGILHRGWQKGERPVGVPLPTLVWAEGKITVKADPEEVDVVQADVPPAPEAGSQPLFSLKGTRGTP